MGRRERKEPQKEGVTAHLIRGEVQLFEGRKNGRQGTLLATLPEADQLSVKVTASTPFGYSRIFLKIDLGDGLEVVSMTSDKGPASWAVDHALNKTVFKGVKKQKRDMQRFQACRNALLGIWSQARIWKRLEEEMAELTMAVSVLEA